MDCIILAGDKDNYRVVANEKNKAFLRIGSQSVLEIMLRELSRVEEIDRILIVGPQKRLDAHISERFGDNYAKPVLVFEQRRDLIENVRHALDQSAAGQDENRMVVILSSDIPVMVAEEVSQFINRCDFENCDYMAGLTTETALTKFYPTEDMPGVVMTYFYFPQGRFRINNMWLVRPSALANIDYISKTYALRYQKEWRNIIMMGLHLFGVFLKVPGAVFFYLGLQCIRLFHAWGFVRLARLLEKPFSLSKAEHYISRLLGIRFKLVITDFGGAAIDIDNDTDFQAICARRDEWVSRQKQMANG